MRRLHSTVHFVCNTANNYTVLNGWCCCSYRQYENCSRPWQSLFQQLIKKQQKKKDYSTALRIKQKSWVEAIGDFFLLGWPIDMTGVWWEVGIWSLSNKKHPHAQTRFQERGMWHGIFLSIHDMTTIKRGHDTWLGRKHVPRGWEKHLLAFFFPMSWSQKTYLPRPPSLSLSRKRKSANMLGIVTSVWR